jgi:hypothetical protein
MVPRGRIVFLVRTKVTRPGVSLLSYSYMYDVTVMNSLATWCIYYINLLM